MSNSTVLCKYLLFSSRNTSYKSLNPHKTLSIMVQLSGGRRQLRGLTPNAKNSHSGKKSWLRKFFSLESGNWLGLKDDDMIEAEEFDSSSEDELSEGEKFEEWRRRAEAIMEVKEARVDMRNEENRRWEDWLVDETNDVSSSSWDGDWNVKHEKLREDVRADPRELIPERGLVKYVRDFMAGSEDEDMLYEDRVFRYASFNSAKFLALLVIIPLMLDFLVHDYVLMPFLERYVKTVPLAAELLDVTRHQKLEIVQELKLEKARYRLEVEIGKSPPLSDEEIWLELRHKALDLREEQRLENRRAFANIWSDMVFGISLFILLYANQNKVALLKFTGYKIINNITDAGKATIIIGLSDLVLGAHSEVGWQALVETILEHYGVEGDQTAISIFVCTFPVLVDGVAKLWLFRNLPRLSPNVEKMIQDMEWD